MTINHNHENVKGISALIRQAMLQEGLTYRELEHRSEKAGNRVKYQSFSQLATSGPKQWPKEASTIRGIASALKTSEEAIVLAFAESFGLTISQRSTFLAQLPSGIEHVSPVMKESILRLINDIIRMEGGGERASSTADSRAAGSAVKDNSD